MRATVLTAEASLVTIDFAPVQCVALRGGNDVAAESADILHDETFALTCATDKADVQLLAGKTLCQMSIGGFIAWICRVKLRG